jgi:hydroxymethylpyrimidine pyrophosphatase-like HAD family hydrolase
LLATDLDGTIIGGFSDFQYYPEFRESLDALQQAHGAVWVACTGRSMRRFLGFSRPLRSMGITPQYVIVHHAFVYQLTPFGYLPHLSWNIHILYHIWTDRMAARQALKRWHDMVTAGALGVRTLRYRKARVTLRFDSAVSAQTAVNMLKKDLTAYRHFQVFSQDSEVDICAIPHTKGVSLIDLERRLGVGREQTLAIGNGHNDLSMLDGDAAGMVGCPSNSEPEVMEMVNRLGGHISASRSLAGVVDVIDAFRTGRVHSELPVWWNSASVARDHYGRSHTHAKRHGSPHTWWLVVVILYTVLLVFATFEIVPFSSLILKPYAVAGSLLQRLLTLLGVP